MSDDNAKQDEERDVDSAEAVVAAEVDDAPTVPTEEPEHMLAASQDPEGEADEAEKVPSKAEPETESEAAEAEEPEAKAEEPESEAEEAEEPESDEFESTTDEPEPADDEQADADEPTLSPKQKAIASVSAAVATISPEPLSTPGVKRRTRRKDRTFYVVGFWKRVLAAAIDLAVIVPIALALIWISSKITGLQLPASNHQGPDYWLDQFLTSHPALVGGLGLMLGIACMYVLIFQITMGRTLGMLALKTRIIDVYGDPPSSGRAVARTVGYVAGFATLSLGFLWIGFDNEKRGLHDWLSGTYVVKA